MEWNSSDCLNLITAYHQHPILWNARHHLYLHRDKKHEAWIAISKRFGCSPEEVRKKMHSLLRSYRREKTKAKKSSDNGKGNFKTYSSTWYAYNKLTFLDDKFDMRNLHNESDDECDVFKSDGLVRSEQNVSEALACVEAVYDVDSISEKPKEQELDQAVKRRRSLEILEVRKRRSPERQFSEVNDEEEDTTKIPCTSGSSIDMRNQPLNDDCVTYGQYLGSKLQEYDTRTKNIVEYHVNNILFQADMGAFGQVVCKVCKACMCEKK